MYDFSVWKAATEALSWGVQRVFHDALSAVAEDGTTMVYGADVKAGMPCLVNTVQPMLATGYGPMSNYPAVVAEFDAINRYFESLGINENGVVSQVAADFLLHNFADLKPVPTAEDITTSPVVAPPVYIEPTDDEFAQHLITMGTAPEVDEAVEVGLNERMANDLLSE